MRVSKIVVLPATLTIIAMVFSCATLKGPTPTEEATAALEDFVAAMKPADLEKIMAAFSEDFGDSQGANKTMVRATIEGMIAQGALEAATIIVEESVITVEGDNATVNPLVVDTPVGRLSFVYKWKKEADGVWRVVNIEQIY